MAHSYATINKEMKQNNILMKQKKLKPLEN